MAVSGYVVACVKDLDLMTCERELPSDHSSRQSGADNADFFACTHSRMLQSLF
jgi:hypothetical protein